MPKISKDGGPSYYGAEGHVEDALGRVHELDPTRDVYGDDTEGLEIEDPESAGLPGRVPDASEAEVHEEEDKPREVTREENSSRSFSSKENPEKEEEKSSAGGSLAASSSKTRSTSAKR